MKVKCIYLIVIILLILGAAVFIYSVLGTPLGENTRLEKVIQGMSVFVALLMAVIALAIADPRKGQVNVEIEPFVDKKHEEEYHKDKMSKSLCQDYKDFDNPVKSYRVQFKMVNTSGFDLMKPIFTFRLPRERKHPEQPERKSGTIRTGDEPSYTSRGFHSNIYNSPSELRILEFAGTTILTNSILPVWNDRDEIVLWVRMALNDRQLKPFYVTVYVNCENADGITENVEVPPRKLLSIT